MQVQSRPLTVGNFMSSPVITVDARADLVDAVSVMTLKGIGNIVVVRDGQSLGILTEREVLWYLAFKKDIPDIPVGQAPLRRFVRLTPERSIEDAARLVATRRSRLLVFKRDDQWQDRLVGIVTASDILKAFLETGKNPPIKGVIQRKVFALAHDRTVLAAIKMMYRHGIGSILVEKDDSPYGMFTERDILNRILPQQVNLEEEVGRYCTRPLLTYRLRIGARTAGRLMTSNGIKRLPLKYRGKIAGIVTARDLVEAFWRDL
jgi:CBS domain-containing protein